MPEMWEETHKGREAIQMRQSQVPESICGGREMNELERVKKEALLTDDEIIYLYDQLAMTNQSCTLAIHSIPYGAVRDWANIIARNQLDKALKTDGIRVEAKDQSLPEKEFISSNENYRYAEAQQDMLKPDSEGKIWVKVEPKGGKE